MARRFTRQVSKRGRYKKSRRKHYQYRKQTRGKRFQKVVPRSAERITTSMDENDELRPNWGAMIRLDWEANYKKYIASDEWWEKRTAVFQRAGGQCENRKCRAVAVDCHHVRYDHVGDEPLCDLIALCRRCHQKQHPRRKLAKDW